MANQILASLTIIGQIFLVLGFVYFLIYRKNPNNFLIGFFGKYGMSLAFIVSLSATALSLFYSDVIGFEPCILCWYQRIFMYPQVFLLGLGLIRKDYKITDYGLLLAIIGGLIALYHNFIYFGGPSVFPCEAFGTGVSCTKRYVFEFGYITIPMMALTSFLLIAGFLYLQRVYNKRVMVQ